MIPVSIFAPMSLVCKFLRRLNNGCYPIVNLSSKSTFCFVSTDDEELYFFVTGRTIIQFTLLMLLCLPVQGQNLHTYNSPGQDCYCEFILTFNPSSRGVIVLDTRGENVYSYAETNPIAISGLFKDYTFLYIDMIHTGSTSHGQCIDIVNQWATSIKYINQELIFYVTDSKLNDEEPDSYSSFQKPYRRVFFRGNDYQGLLSELEALTWGKSFVVKENLTNQKRIYNEKMANYSGNFDVSFFITPTILIGNQFYLERRAVTTFGLGVSKNLSARHTLGFSVDASLKPPDQKGLEMSIRRDARDAILSGDDTLFINEQVQGHILYSFQFEYRLFFCGHNRMRWFLGAGIGFTKSKFSKGEIIESMDISNVSISDPSSIQDLADFNPIVYEKGLENFHGLLEFGLQYRMTPVTKFDLSIPVRSYFDHSLTHSGNMIVGLNIGLSFTLNLGND